MLLNPKTPIFVGVFLIAGLGAALMVYAPMPGGLASPHAQLHDSWTLENCSTCHHEAGLTQGCLSCHEEIAAQIDEGVGYHHYLLKGKEVTCKRCHSEHLGEDFALINKKSWGAQNPAEFKHPHVEEYHLKGKHDELFCRDCHESDIAPPVQLASFAPRERSFLGLDQDCASCHEDIHAGGLTGSCEDCHGQDFFRPAAHFDHSDHFPLDGGHERIACVGCHPKPSGRTKAAPASFPFHRAQGEKCMDCHESPHSAEFLDTCDACHPGSHAEWNAANRAVTPERHALTGFRLMEPHTEVACEKCHAPELPFHERYADPAAEGYLRHEDTCQGCHRDVHEGQFEEKYQSCLDCHDSMRFHPTTFGESEHREFFQLTGRHRAIPCTSCHEAEAGTDVRQFVGTANECKVCHQDPHGGQFSKELTDGDCDACHNEKADTFSLWPFDHVRRAGYALEGAHARTQCEGCHLETFVEAGTSSAVRHYRGTPTDCASCHKDVHRAQFQENGSTDCSKCHGSFDSWKQHEFDHNTQSRFPLDGAHARVQCSGCHIPARLADGSEIIQYKPLGRECRDCHEVVPDSKKRRRVR